MAKEDAWFLAGAVVQKLPTRQYKKQMNQLNNQPMKKPSDLRNCVCTTRIFSLILGLKLYMFGYENHLSSFLYHLWNCESSYICTGSHWFQGSLATPTRHIPVEKKYHGSAPFSPHGWHANIIAIIYWKFVMFQFASWRWWQFAFIQNKTREQRCISSNPNLHSRILNIYILSKHYQKEPRVLETIATAFFVYSEKKKFSKRTFSDVWSLSKKKQLSSNLFLRHPLAATTDKFSYLKKEVCLKHRRPEPQSASKWTHSKFFAI